MSDSEDTEPGVVTNEFGGKSSDIGVRPSLLPGRPLLLISRVMTLGAAKYGDDNWRRLTLGEQMDHAIAHVFNLLDADDMPTQIEQLAHAACRLIMALDTALSLDGDGDDDDDGERSDSDVPVTDTPPQPPEDMGKVIPFPSVLTAMEEVARARWTATEPTPVEAPSLHAEVVIDREYYSIHADGHLLIKKHCYVMARGLAVPVPPGSWFAFATSDGRQLFGEELDEFFSRNFKPGESAS